MQICSFTTKTFFAIIRPYKRDFTEGFKEICISLYSPVFSIDSSSHLLSSFQNAPVPMEPGCFGLHIMTGESFCVWIKTFCLFPGGIDDAII